jgi:hypothetical protein
LPLSSISAFQRDCTDGDRFKTNVYSAPKPHCAGARAAPEAAIAYLPKYGQGELLASQCGYGHRQGADGKVAQSHGLNNPNASTIVSYCTERYVFGVDRSIPSSSGRLKRGKKPRLPIPIWRGR